MNDVECRAEMLHSMFRTVGAIHETHFLAPCKRHGIHMDWADLLYSLEPNGSGMFDMVY